MADRGQTGKRERLLGEIRQLKDLLREREAALPAHSVRPQQLLAIEELEEKIAAREKELEQSSD